MLRRALMARLSGYFLGRRSAGRWRGAAAAGAAMLAAAAVWWLAAEPPRRPVRMAVRVECSGSACALAESLASDVWSEQRGPGLPLDVVVTRGTLERLSAAGVRWQLLVPDVDAVADAEAARLQGPAATRPSDWFAEYHDYDAITAHLRGLVEQAPERIALQAIGGSIEGRPLWALRIGHAGAAPGAPLLPVLINGTQHAREWIAAMVTTCIADRLVRDYDRDPRIRAFVDRTDLWVVPVVNPDGYQYSWSGRRYWRKNRREDHGVDLNRNFDIAWGGRGSSSRKTADDYRGEHAFSEPETAAMRDLVKREHIALHIDYHAYGQLLLYPWGHTESPAKDRARFAAIGDRMASAMFAEHEVRYTLMPSIDLYPASGTMSDWVYAAADALSYTIELRPKGVGFVLPPEQIRPTCDEGLAGLLALRASVN